VTDYDYVVTGLAIFAKSVGTASYTIVFIFASEIYPTEVRNAAMGSTMMAGCIANIASPYFGKPMVKFTVTRLFYVKPEACLISKRIWQAASRLASKRLASIQTTTRLLASR
jgi:hypothetical protein